MGDVDVLGYLLGKGWNAKRAGGLEYHGACFWHGESPDERGRLYVNCDPAADILGLFECKVCGQHGAFPTIQRHFGDTPASDAGDDDSEVRLEILRVAAGFYHQELGDNADVFGWLRGPERMLTTESIIDHQIGYATDEVEWDVSTKSETRRPSRALYTHLRDVGYEKKDILATGLAVEITRNSRTWVNDGLSGMVTIPYKVAGNIVQIRGRAWPYEKGDAKPKYKTCGGNQSRLFNSDACWDTNEIILTEGEFDAIVLGQMGFKAVGVPGARQWQDTWDGYMADMRRMWLVFDRDVPGEDGARKIVERFGARVKRVHLSPEGVKCDPTEWSRSHTADDFTELLEEAQRSGMLITVRQAIEEHTKYQGQPGLKFGWENLDAIIDPGLHPAQVATVLAKTGTGKTIWLLNMMQRMLMVPGQEELRFLFLSLEQTRGEWWERARRIHRFYNLEADDNECEEFWRDRIMLVDRNRLTANDWRAAIDDFDYRMGHLPDVVCLDYLGYFAQSFPGDRYTRTSDAALTVKEISKETRIPTVVPHQVSRVARDGEEFGADAARDAGVVEESADYIFTIWSPDNTLARSEEEKQGIIKLRIGKSRHGGKGQHVDMHWAPLSLTMIPQGDPRVPLARDELLYASSTYRDDWETAVWRHRTGLKGVTPRKAIPAVPQLALVPPQPLALEPLEGDQF